MGKVHVMAESLHAYQFPRRTDRKRLSIDQDTVVAGVETDDHMTDVINAAVDLAVHNMQPSPAYADAAARQLARDAARYALVMQEVLPQAMHDDIAHGYVDTIVDAAIDTAPPTYRHSQVMRAIARNTAEMALNLKPIPEGEA